MILAGDIGGTKTHLALFEDSDKFKRIKEEKYLSKDYGSLLEILKIFLSSHSSSVQKACFGIAGPIKNNKCHATNLPWIIEGDKIALELNIPSVFLINDLEANAYGLRCLTQEEFLTLNEGDSTIVGNAALISAGTGLGEAGMYWDGKRHCPFGCEGGHVDFAPRDELEMELLYYLRKKYKHTSYERVLSGPGIYNLYQFLVDMSLEEETQSMKEELAAGDPPKIIREKALSNESMAAVRAMDWFASIYGSAAGNLALKFLALGGVYVGGGIAPKILNVLQKGEFMRAFIDKGRMSSLLSAMPVRVVLNENTALLGAALYAQSEKK